MRSVDIKDLYIVFDCITDEEIKRFETEHIKFAYARTHTTIYNIVEKQIVFRTNGKPEIHFFMSLRKQSENDYILEMDFECRIKNHSSPGYNGWFLPDFIEDLDPIISFFDEKKQLIQKSVKENKALRLFFLTGESKFSVESDIKNTFISVQWAREQYTTAERIRRKQRALESISRYENTKKIM